MKKWNHEAFRSAIRNWRTSYVRGEIQVKEDGYTLTNISEICLYLADVVLPYANVSGDAVYEWTKKRSKGPKEEAYVEWLESFFGVPLKSDTEKGEIDMRKEYSDFTKARVYEVHLAVLAYLDNMDEDEFWKMQEVIDANSIAIPQNVYDAVQGFVDQYLEEDLFGAIYSKKVRNQYDLSEVYDEAEKVECPNPDCGEAHVKWFQLKTMYDEIARRYLAPVLFKED